MSGNSHASHLYNTGSAYNASPPLQHQQVFQQGPYTRADSGSSGYGSGGVCVCVCVCVYVCVHVGVCVLSIKRDYLLIVFYHRY